MTGQYHIRHVTYSSVINKLNCGIRSNKIKILQLNLGEYVVLL